MHRLVLLSHNFASLLSPSASKRFKYLQFSNTSYLTSSILPVFPVYKLSNNHQRQLLSSNSIIVTSLLQGCTHPPGPLTASPVSQAPAFNLRLETPIIAQMGNYSPRRSLLFGAMCCDNAGWRAHVAKSHRVSKVGCIQIWSG
jgi:hypothetical protein